MAVRSQPYQFKHIIANLAVKQRQVAMNMAVAITAPSPVHWMVAESFRDARISTEQVNYF